MKTKAPEHELNYWEALPIPRKWRTVEENDEGKRNGKEELAKSIWNEWISAHPMDGD